jgi:hypothetical protein
LILMAVGHQKIGKRILDHLRKNSREPSARGRASTVNGVAHQAVATASADVHTHTSPHTTCIMVVKPTTAQKIAPYFSSLKER